MASFEDRVEIGYPVDVVFEFFTFPQNHERMGAGHLGLAFTSAPSQFQLGSQLEFQIQVLGQVQSSTHEIIAFERPHLYVEQQIQGAMRAWRHEHRFVAEGDRTIISDRVDFEPPGGLLGFVATEERILRSLEESIYSRNQILKKLLAAEAGRAH